MPILDVATSTSTLLEVAGLKKENQSLKDLLEENSLSTERALSVVAEIAHNGESDAIRLRAAEMALKMNGALAEDSIAPISVNIIIRDSAPIEINPILIPRSL